VVALHEHPIRPYFSQHWFQPRQHSGGHLGGRLTLLHQIQILIGHDVKKVQHLIQHIPMLSRSTDMDLKAIRLLPQLSHHRGHLDRLGAGAEAA
jgi:hypothetical protein